MGWWSGFGLALGKVGEDEQGGDAADEAGRAHETAEGWRDGADCGVDPCGEGRWHPRGLTAAQRFDERQLHVSKRLACGVDGDHEDDEGEN